MGRKPSITQFGASFETRPKGGSSEHVSDSSTAHPLACPAEVGAVCGKAARTVLCAARAVMLVPTATVARCAPRNDSGNLFEICPSGRAPLSGGIGGGVSRQRLA